MSLFFITDAELKKRCGKRSANGNGSPHICTREKKHKGRHRCAYPSCQKTWVKCLVARRPRKMKIVVLGGGLDEQRNVRETEKRGIATN